MGGGRLGWSLFATALSLAILMASGGCERLRDRYRMVEPEAAADSTAAPIAPPSGETGSPTQLLSSEVGASGTELESGVTAAPLLIDRGTGRLIAEPPAASMEAAQNGAITLNFVNTDIRDVISAVLGDALKLSYVIDPRVQGTVTIRTSRPLDAEDVLPVLENILTMNGAVLVKSMDTYSVVPLEGGGGGFHLQPGYGIHIIPLKYASASAMQSVLEPYVPPGRILRTDIAHNVLIFTGTTREARELDDLVQTFDVDWMTGMSFAIYSLRSADSKTVAQELERVFGQDFAGPLAGLVQFLPIERQNAILVITTQPEYLDKAAVWMERLDQSQEGDQQRAYVYLVQNGSAKDLAAVLSDVYGAGGQNTTEPPRLAPGTTPAEITSYPTLSPSATEPAPETMTVEPAPTTDAVMPEETLESPLELVAAEGIPIGGEANIRFVADERNNALLILATPAQYRRVLATLRQIDLVPLQVLIEATIAEVTLNDELRYGIQWFFALGDTSFTFSAAESGAVNPIFPGFNFIFSSEDARVVLNALTSITDVRIISAPQLLVLDNEPARLQVGDQVPIVTQQATSVIDPESPLVNTVEYRDTGVILEIIPHVNASGLVILEITQEVSDVAETITSGIDSPTIQQRQITSTVAVQTGEMVALGGLIRDRQTDGVTGIPLLSEIPILGNLFKTTSNIKDRTELLILLTPRVVRSSQDARQLTEELRQRIPSVTILENRLIPRAGEEEEP